MLKVQYPPILRCRVESVGEDSLMSREGDLRKVIEGARGDKGVSSCALCVPGLTGRDEDAIACCWSVQL